MITSQLLTDPFRKRELKKNQHYTKDYNNSNFPFYSLERIYKPNWLLFMWFASLETIENYICLFIVIWDAIQPQDYSLYAEFTIEFNDEISKMIQIIEELEITDNLKTYYSRIFDDYKNYRQHDQDLKRRLVNGAWVELEDYGLKLYSHAVEDQLKVLPPEYKKELRTMVFSRMKSFRSFGSQIRKAYKETTIKKDDKQEIIKENENLKDQVATLIVKENPQASLRNSTKNDIDPNKSNKVKNSKGDKGDNGDNGDKSLLKENERLKSQIATLVKENSQQQAALGNLTNLSWNDEDPNNTTKLISNIEELQDMLLDFTMVQGSDYKIKEESASNLLKTYNCHTTTKLVLGAVLQRHAITTILDGAQRYLKGVEDIGQNIAIERDIVNTTDKLIKYTELFRDNRKGEDEITKITPIKIRQHTYSALSCRGFPDEHPLIKQIANNLLNELNKFREVVDKETNEGLQDQAIQITRGVINLFCFHLKTQAPEPTYQFFPTGQDVDNRLMQGAFRRDETKRLEVEACGFPCIGVFDKSNQKVFTKAQVITRPKKK